MEDLFQFLKVNSWHRSTNVGAEEPGFILWNHMIVGKAKAESGSFQQLSWVRGQKTWASPPPGEPGEAPRSRGLGPSICQMPAEQVGPNCENEKLSCRTAFRISVLCSQYYH